MKFVLRIIDFFRNLKITQQIILRELLRQNRMIGRQLSFQVSSFKEKIDSLKYVEFQVFSQFGDDGIIQYLVSKIDIPNKTFIEFGVENYEESNTRFLLMNNNWSGFVMDGSESNIQSLLAWDELWKFDLQAKAAFIDRDNINSLVSEAGFDKEVGLLHIDIDGNDYWVWKEIKDINPIIVIVEYNSVFGMDRPITIPYNPSFQRNKAHYSNLYWGASLPALYELACSKGYAFVGSNSAGNNAYFIRKDKLEGASEIKQKSLDEGFLESKYRESRGEEGSLTYIRGKKRLDVIKGLPVINIKTDKEECI
jgi:hypothetical protein